MSEVSNVISGITKHSGSLKTGMYFFIKALAVSFVLSVVSAIIGLVTHASALIIPLALLISRPIVWCTISMIVSLVVTHTFKYASKLIGNFTNKGEQKDKGDEQPERKRNIPEKENTPEKLKRSESPDSGLGSTLTGSIQTLAYRDSLDSGIYDKKISNTLAMETKKKNYGYWLQHHDIAHIARVAYQYTENLEKPVFFCVVGNVQALNTKLKNYMNKINEENFTKVFTSIINVDGNHWVMLSGAYDMTHKKFNFYYCDSFATQLPNTGKDINFIKEVKSAVTSLTEQANNYKENGDEKKAEDVKKTVTCIKKENEFMFQPINSEGVTSVLNIATKNGKNGSTHSSKIEQQQDGHNCGIFALLNSKVITDVFLNNPNRSSGEVFSEIEKNLEKNKFSEEQLKAKRREFSDMLESDREWKEACDIGLFIGDSQSGGVTGATISKPLGRTK